jgi:flagellar basal-body rod protein FlgB
MQQVQNDVFALAEKRLQWIDKRQDVLARNIANVNTPGYMARDLKPFGEFLAQSTAAAGAGTNTLKQPSQDRTVAEESLDRNTVSLDSQLEKVADNDTAHQLAMNLYKTYQNLFRTAIGRS